MSDSTPQYSRRRLGRGVLLGGSLGAAGLAGLVAPADADGGAQRKKKKVRYWALGGNATIKPSHYLGGKNVAALVFKTAATAGSPVERMRIQPTGEVVAAGLLQSATAKVTGALSAASATFTGALTAASATLSGALTVNGLVSAKNKLVAATTDTSGAGIVATAPNSISTALAARGIDGKGTVGVMGDGEYMGVQGSSLNYGVFGLTTPDSGGIGVYGRGGTGVKGRSYTGFAVHGDTDSGTGVKGESYSDGGAVKAIHGEAFGASNNGVVGEASNGASSYGVWGISTAGYAGVFSGKALVTGTLSKGAGSFKIDHPLAPTRKYLYHSFVESPDMMNIYNGNVTTGADGRATVELPDYFESLNRDFRYQLTVIGGFAQAVVGREVGDGSFVIETDKPGVKVSWQVTGIRQDAFANANRIPVEEDKTGDEVGTYLHPEVFGKPVSAGFQSGRLAARTPSTKPPVPSPGERPRS